MRMHSLLVLSVKSLKKRIVSCIFTASQCWQSLESYYYWATIKQNRLNGFVTAYVHRDVDINSYEILKLYTQECNCRLDLVFEFEK